MIVRNYTSTRSFMESFLKASPFLRTSSFLRTSAPTNGLLKTGRKRQLQDDSKKIREARKKNKTEQDGLWSKKSR